MGSIPQWDTLLRDNANDYVRVALTNIEREFPYAVYQVMQAPNDFPHRPRELSPAFYGSFDWHSCVEMHWLLVRLLRRAGDIVPQQEIRAALDAHFTAEALAAEAAFISHPMYGGRERPYGWGWALQLVHEIITWDDPDAQRWAINITPLAEALTSNFLHWLPKATYPVRHGMHPNSAFGLSRSLPYAYERAQSGDATLLDAITANAHRWYDKDANYPGHFEPSGTDFLSPALVEAELMAQLLPSDHFARWLDTFLPGIVNKQPIALFTPAVVSDSSDGFIAHLHGLNASRAWCWRRIAESLPAGDPRIEPALTAAWRHANTVLPHATGDDYMVDHWLACFVVLMLSEGRSTF